MFVGMGANSGGGVYNLESSLRLRGESNSYLSRTFTNTGNQKTWTYSAWIKRGTLSDLQAFFYVGNSTSTERGGIFFAANNTINIGLSLSGSTTTGVGADTTAVFRDPSAWYHIVWQLDTTQATGTDRMKFYVNGVRQTLTFTTTPSQNADLVLNKTGLVHMTRHPSGDYEFKGYLTEVNFIDGQALTPSDFGETDTITGVWKPKEYTGTYGTNGFYLNFSDSTSTTTLGYDQSPNSNNWTLNNISLTAGANYDLMNDVPTLTDEDTANYCVLNPVIAGTTNLSNGNLTRSGSVYTNVGTMLLTSGKYYFETTIQDSNSNGGVGVKQSTAFPIESYDTSKCATYFANGEYKIEGASQTSGFSSYTNGDVIGCAVDTTQSPAKIWWSKNNTWQGTGDPTTAGYSLTSGLDYYFIVLHGSGSSSTTASANFGQRPFAYTPPTGYKKLNTYNLPDSTIKDGSQYMNTVLYTGNSSTNAITGVGFSPDLVWYKSRSNAYYHYLHDTIRGTTKSLYSNATDAEATNANALTSFDSDGFTLGSDTGSNGSGATFVAWNWRGSDSSAVSNTDGTITSTVSANTDSGFSIVTYTGNGTAGATVGHGLGVAPAMMIVKNRDAAQYWIVQHQSLAGITYNLYLQTTDSQQPDSQFTGKSATTVTLNGLSINTNGNKYVMYAFAEVEGFSKFGSYTGNGSSNGPFVYTGFRPAFVMYKRTDIAANWRMNDTARDTNNDGSSYDLFANSSQAEASSARLDILSNGFKCIATSADTNGSGGTYIYMAFAETPFKQSLAR